MAHLRPSLSRSFLLMGGDRSIGEASRLVRRTDPRYVVVTGGEAEDPYLLGAKDFEAGAAGVDPSLPLWESGLLCGMAPALVRSAADARAGEGPCLVLEDGMLTGVLARRHPLPPSGNPFSGKEPLVGAGEREGAQYVRAALPERVAAGECVVLAVEVGAEGPLALSLSAGSEVDVVVQAREGFALEGSAFGTLRVPGGEETARAEFQVRALAPGPALVRVYAFHDGSVLGSLALRPVVASGPGGGVGPEPVSLLSGSGFLGAAPPSPPADLSLLILEERVDDRPVLRIRVTGRDAELGLNLREFGAVPLRMEPVEYFRAFFEDVQALGEQSLPGEVVRQKLEGKGASLYESLFPEALRTLLWEHRDRISSIQIQSDEAWIPWELCRLTGMGDGAVVEGQFFCEAFEITRWIPGVARRPRLTLHNMAVVVPRDSGLHSVREELDFLLSLAEGGASVTEVPARYVDVRSALAAGTFDAFHFSGHGILRAPDPNHSSIRLEGADELRPEDISGVIRNLGKSRPLVFLNSCNGARGAFTIVGTGGWARRCLDAGAGAFIGAYWSVSDEAACGFAQAFYREVRAGKSVGAAVRAARIAIRTPDDPTWLAYTVFGDPAAVVHV